MTVRVEHDEDECQFVVHVSCKNISSESEIEKTFDDLDAALNKIEGRLDDEDIYYFLINLEAAGVPAGPGPFDPYDEGGECLGPHNPWEVFCPPFWSKANAVPRLRQRARDWLARLEKTLQLAESKQRSTDSLWEDDQTQFGEPVATHMALLDVECVPAYTRLFRRWDMGHEVNTGGAILQIVNKHGIRAETAELIQCYQEWDPDDELGLVKRLQTSKGR